MDRSRAFHVPEVTRWKRLETPAVGLLLNLFLNPISVRFTIQRLSPIDPSSTSVCASLHQ